MLLRAIEDVQAGREPPHVVRDPGANDFSHLAIVSTVVPRGTDLTSLCRRAAPTGQSAAAG